MSDAKLPTPPTLPAGEEPAAATANDEVELPHLWKQVQSAIWLLGLALIAWQGWWWPGILVLVAISGITQALMANYVQRGQVASEQSLARTRLEAGRIQALPANCPACGGALDAGKVQWRSDTVAVCPYCTSPISVTLKP